MAPTPRRTIDPEFIAGWSCPICGANALELHTMARYPDYVDCGSCQSQFVAEEGGDRVMFGKIPNAYAKTRRFALQQWVWPEAIARRAAEERPSSPPAPASAPPAEPAEAAPVEADLADFGPEADMAETGAAADMVEPMADLAEFEDAAEMTEPEADMAEFEAAADMADIEADLDAVDAPDLPDWGAGEWEPETARADDMAAMEPEQDLQTPELATTAEAPTELMADESADTDSAVEADAADDVFAPAQSSAMDSDDAQPTSWMGDEPDSALERETTEPPGSAESPTDWPDLSESDTSSDLPGSPAPVDDAQASPDQEDDLLDVFGAAASAVTTPPFAEAEAADDMEPPADLEPAPAMPSWLASDPQSDVDDGIESEDEAVEPPPDEAEMLERLWQSTDPGLFEAPSDTDSDLDGEALPDWDAAEMDSLEAMTDEADLSASDPSEGELSQADLARMHWGGQALMDQEEQAEPAIGQAAELEERGPQEPLPGERFRVVLQSSQAQLPETLCAHCGRTPADANMSVTATVYRGAGLGERQMASYRLPVCSDCQSRSQARSEEQQTASLQAHLVSVLVAMIMVVSALAFRLVDFQGNLLLDLVILGLMAGMGYAIPAVFLLIRASSYPQPPDAEFVKSTLRIPADTEGAETAFEWRNRAYADQFHAANKELAVSRVTKITERSYESA